MNSWYRGLNVPHLLTFLIWHLTHCTGAPRQNKNNHLGLFRTSPDTWPHFTFSSIHSSDTVSGDAFFVNWWLVSWLVFVTFCCCFWWNCSKNVPKAAISLIASLLISYLLFLQQQFKHPVQLKEVFELVDIELFEFVEHFRFLFIECKPKLLWFNFACNKSKSILFNYENTNLIKGSIVIRFSEQLSLFSVQSALICFLSEIAD